MIAWLPYLVFSLLSAWVTFLVALALNRWMAERKSSVRAGLAIIAAILPAIAAVLVAVAPSGGAVLLSTSPDEFMVPFILQNLLTLAIAAPVGLVMSRKVSVAKHGPHEPDQP